MSRYLLTGGRLIDPAAGTDERSDLLIEDGMIGAVGSALDGKGAEVIDVSGAIVAPGLVDLHTHVREPGREDEETIASASASAAAGGYTAICTMPNTDPVADSASIAEKVWALGREAGLVEVVAAGALSKGQRGEKMADIGEMVRSVAGVRLFTDDGHGVQDSLFVRRRDGVPRDLRCDLRGALRGRGTRRRGAHARRGAFDGTRDARHPSGSGGAHGRT